MDIGGKRVNRPEVEFSRSVKKEDHPSAQLHRRLTRYYSALFLSFSFSTLPLSPLKLWQPLRLNER